MKVELDKKDLIALVMGSQPQESIHREISNLGTYQGHYRTWQWYSYKVSQLEDEMLWSLYQKVKGSWD